MATVTELRSQIASLSDAAKSDLALVWAEIFTPDLKAERAQVVEVGGDLRTWSSPLIAAVREALGDVLPVLVGDYSSAAAVTAVDWYVGHREEQGVRGSFTPDLPLLGSQGVDELAGWGTSLIVPEDVDWDAALSRISGGMQRRIADAGRETIANAAFDDPQALGWQRVARAGACPFCLMLAGRGSVYTSRDTADFGAHDSCSCMATPAFNGKPIPVKPYTPTSRNITDADRARTREWIKANSQ